MGIEIEDALLVQKEEQRILLRVLGSNEGYEGIAVRMPYKYTNRKSHENSDFNMRIKMPENCLVLEVCFYMTRDSNKVSTWMA